MGKPQMPNSVKQSLLFTEFVENEINWIGQYITPFATTAGCIMVSRILWRILLPERLPVNLLPLPHHGQEVIFKVINLSQLKCLRTQIGSSSTLLTPLNTRYFLLYSGTFSGTHFAPSQLTHPG